MISVIKVTVNAIAYMLDKIIPSYRGKCRDKPPNGVKHPLSFFVLLLSAGIIHGICININDTDDVNINYESYIININNSAYTGTLSNLTLEEIKIEYYIEKSRTVIIPKKDLLQLSAKQLNCIRNGILAYHGLYFESGYYEKVKYFGYSNLEEEFDWKVLNEFEITNIENIKSIESFKKMD